jgi:hypothetical protein
MDTHKRIRRGIFKGLALLYLSPLIFAAPRPPLKQVSTSQILNIQPVMQQTPEWCWVASAQMIFQFYSLPPINLDYQCGIVAAYFGINSPCWYNCFACSVGIASVSNLQKLINNYGNVANQLNLQSRDLNSALLFRSLTIDEIITEIDGNRPIFSGISPNSFAYPNVSQHATVIVGYDTTGVASQIIVNDPWPYDLPYFNASPNPYIAAGGVEILGGQFKISLNAFVSRLKWGNTIFNIQ